MYRAIGVLQRTGESFSVAVKDGDQSRIALVRAAMVEVVGEHSPAAFVCIEIHTGTPFSSLWFES